VAVFLKAAFSVLVFASAFYFHHWVGQQAGERVFPLAHSEEGASRKEAVPLGPFNINTASVQDLIALPGIGSKLAEAIVKDRAKQGPFLMQDDLLRVRGIGPKKLKKIVPFLRFDAPGK